MEFWASLGLIALGVFHGINPAMGWLFAVALGLHRQRRAIVAWAILPLALGHAAAVAAALAALAAAGVWLRTPLLGAVAGAMLIVWGLYHLLRGHRHRLRVGMTAGLAGLALWSFLAASAHGAGLMLAPVLLEGGSRDAGTLSDAGAAALAGLTPQLLLTAVALHTLAMAATAAAIALAVYHWIGLAILRRAWLNLDRLWAAALIGAGLLMLGLYLRPLLNGLGGLG